MPIRSSRATSWARYIGESGLAGSMIGRIDIFEEHSIVNLPEGMPSRSSAR